jgi:hypothetical protein
MRIAPAVYFWYTDWRHEGRLLLVMVGLATEALESPIASPYLFTCSRLEAREASTYPSRKSPKKAHSYHARANTGEVRLRLQ